MNMNNKVEKLVTNHGENMMTELVDTITSDSTTDTVVSVADSILNVAYSDTVRIKLRDAILKDENFTGVLYSLKFNDLKYSIIVRTHGDICYVYPVEGKVLRKGQKFDPNDYRNIADQYSKNIGKEQLLFDLEESFNEFRNYFKEEVERRIALAILQIKHLSWYAPKGLPKIKFPQQRERQTFGLDL